MKKAISLFLSIILIFSVSSTAFAANIESEVIATSDIVQEDEDGNVFILRSKDYENGDALFQLFENGNLVAESYLDRSCAEITSTEYIDGVATEIQTIQAPVEQSTKARAAASAKYTKAGRVGFDCYSQGYVMATNYLDLYYSEGYVGASTCTLNGTFKNVAAVAGALTTALGVPGIIASKLAVKILAFLGIAVGATDIWFEREYIEAEEYTVTWKAVNPYGSDSLDDSPLLSGSKYIVTSPKYEGIVVYDDDYYAVSSFRNHDENLALYFGDLFFSWYELLEVVSWK